MLYRELMLARRFLTGGLLVCAVAAAHAGTPSMAPLPEYQQECAACHVAYPAGMLPAASWRRLLQGLDKHFGVNASLDEATTQKIGAWLNLHGGSFRHAHEEPAQDRITRSNWFVRQHSEIGHATWQRKSVGSASNCGACHPGAARGDFDEDAVRVPK